MFGWPELILLVLIVIILATFFSSLLKRHEKIKRKISLIEDDVRRAKSLVMELKLGSEIEVALDSIRTELSDLYVKPKSGEKVNKLLDNCEETAKELILSIEGKNVERVKMQMSQLRSRIADIRSEFKR